MNNEAMESNRLELHDPQDWEVPPIPIGGNEEDEDSLWEEEFEESEAEYKLGLYGPRPGRWETGWS